VKNEVLSFIIYSDFGFFKKPDVNIDYLTYEYIPKPALLGILGSIAGLGGYSKNEEVPEFYEKFESLKIGIQPLKLKNYLYLPISSDNFLPLEESFLKTFVKYNNYHGYGSYEAGGNLIVNEQILIRPAYRIYLERGEAEEEIYNKLKKNLENQWSCYTPYMGKNDFPLSFIYEGMFSYKISKEDCIKISTLFFKDIISREVSFLEEGSFYKIYNNYPYCLDENQQYRYKKAIYSNAMFYIERDKIKENNYKLWEINGKNIFLF